MKLFLKTAFIFLFLSNLTYAKNINKEVSFSCMWQVAHANYTTDFGTSILKQKRGLDYKPKWVSLKTKDFKCKFPNQKPIKTPTLEYYQIVETIEGAKCDFAVLIRKEDLTHRTRQEFYQKSKENIIESKRKEVSTKDIKIDKLDAVEIQYEENERTTRAFYVLNKKMNTIILIMVVGEKSTINKDFVDKFVNSFKIK